MPEACFGIGSSLSRSRGVDDLQLSSLRVTFLFLGADHFFFFFAKARAKRKRLYCLFPVLPSMWNGSLRAASGEFFSFCGPQDRL